MQIMTQSTPLYCSLSTMLTIFASAAKDWTDVTKEARVPLGTSALERLGTTWLEAKGHCPESDWIIPSLNQPMTPDDGESSRPSHASNLRDWPLMKVMLKALWWVRMACPDGAVAVTVSDDNNACKTCQRHLSILSHYHCFSGPANLLTLLCLHSTTLANHVKTFSLPLQRWTRANKPSRSIAATKSTTERWDYWWLQI